MRRLRRGARPAGIAAEAVGTVRPPRAAAPTSIIPRKLEVVATSADPIARLAAQGCYGILLGDAAPAEQTAELVAAAAAAATPGAPGHKAAAALGPRRGALPAVAVSGELVVTAAGTHPVAGAEVLTGSPTATAATAAGAASSEGVAAAEGSTAATAAEATTFKTAAPICAPACEAAATHHVTATSAASHAAASEAASSEVSEGACKGCTAAAAG